jgi:hypothetical protein
MEDVDANDLAAAWLKKTEVEVDEGTFVDRSARDKVTVKDVVQCFVDTEMQVGGKRRGAAEDLGQDAIGDWASHAAGRDHRSQVVRHRF